MGQRTLEPPTGCHAIFVEGPGTPEMAVSQGGERSTR